MIRKTKKQMTYTTNDIIDHYARRAAAQAEAARLAAEVEQEATEEQAA